MFSRGNTLLSAFHTASMKLAWEIVVSLSFEKTGTTQSSFKCCMLTSFVFASIKGSLDVNWGVITSSATSAISASVARLRLG